MGGPTLSLLCHQGIGQCVNRLYHQSSFVLYHRAPDDDTSDEDEVPERGRVGIANVTERIMKQGGEKQIYVEINEIRR